MRPYSVQGMCLPKFHREFHRDTTVRKQPATPLRPVTELRGEQTAQRMQESDLTDGS